MPEADLTDVRRPVITTVAEAEAIRVKVIASAARTAAWLRGFSDDPMLLLRKLRSETVGHDPLTGEPLNMVEQLNQTFTILVTLCAIERLIDLHPEAGGFRLALGTSSGTDIEGVAPPRSSPRRAPQPTRNSRRMSLDLSPFGQPTAMCSLQHPVSPPDDKRTLRPRRIFRFTLRRLDPRNGRSWAGGRRINTATAARPFRPIQCSLLRRSVPPRRSCWAHGFTNEMLDGDGGTAGNAGRGQPIKVIWLTITDIGRQALAG
jgi:hypothetical protein